jgi:pimeloyl-ACP methyl ester carboxylesterase
VDRKIEDIDALIGDAGGSAFLYGHSSGSTLAMQAAVQLGSRVTRTSSASAGRRPPAWLRGWQFRPW